jgi:hypothetical protein
MYSANAESEVSTLHLGYDDIDAVLAKAIADDCLRAGERSSYRTRANKIFLHEDRALSVPFKASPRSRFRRRLRYQACASFGSGLTTTRRDGPILNCAEGRSWYGPSNY